jgi:hypothetical protein
MRFLVRAKMPVEAGNALVRNPNMGKLMESILADLKPEATYYCLDGGQRTIYFVINVTDSHQIPGILEPLWLTMKADIEFIPAMNQDEFNRAVPSIQQAVKKY